MKNRERWQPSKLIWNARRGCYEAHRGRVSPGSWFVVDQVAALYSRVIAEHAQGRLLDCGCGQAPYYGLYRDRVSEITCVDWGNSAHGQEHVDVQLDLNAPLPFPAARFDTVLLADVLEHVREPALLLHEIGRVLSPTGKLIAMVPFLYRVHEAPHDYFRYTEFALRALASDVALQVLELEPYGGLPDVLGDLVNKALGSSRPLSRAFVAGSRLVTTSAPYLRWRGRTQQSFPLGYVLVAAAPA